jgi:hypothetical protein
MDSCVGNRHIRIVYDCIALYFCSPQFFEENFSVGKFAKPVTEIFINGSGKDEVFIMLPPIIFIFVKICL